MAIAFDAASNGGYSTPSPTTWNQTCTGADRFLVVGLNAYVGGDIVTLVTYGVQTMTQLFKVNTGGANWLYIYYLVAPATGSNLITVTFVGGTDVGGVSSSYTGVLQTSTIDSTVNSLTGASSPITTTVTTTVNNDWNLCVTGTQRDHTASTGSTVRATNATATSCSIFDSNGPKTPAGAYSMTTTILSGGDGQAQFAFKPSVASGPTNIKTWDGVTQSTGIKSYFGVSLASVKSVNGVT